MNFKTLMVCKAAVALVFGLLLIAVPEIVYALLGTTLGKGGMFAARQYASAMLGDLMIAWFGRDAKESEARRAVILGLFVYDAAGFLAVSMAVMDGSINSLGWGIAALYLFFAIGFGYFTFRSPKP